jgi:hypothetical protein
LSLPIQSDQALGEQAQALARQIAGPNASALIQMLASRVAEAEFDLRRVRLARHQLLSQALSDPLCDFRANLPMAARDRFVPLTPQDNNKIATIFLREAKALEAMDRYERRARSRRKFAIRAFDMAWGHTRRKRE